ncbi:cell surface A33 antigen-like isoform X1 [Chrysemys picta bellii]|uniref:cell surface A33 antigen-like isoform X1 n=1 Tax=Chrysemys picta bellii TaxID=8478 RepID=UPI0032B142F2
MRARLERLSLLWALLLSPWLGAAENTAAVFGVNQTPPSIRAMEGSEFTIECTFNSSNNSIKWFVEWNKTRNYVTEKLSNGTDRIRLSGDKEKRSPSLTVKKADVTDSGTYVCWVGNKDGTSRGNGTQVTIDEITDLMVNQTPTSVNDLEGSELTMKCTFKTVNNHSTMYVRWYKYGTEGPKKELVNDSDVITTVHLENRFASLTLKNANSSNTGTYVCEVGITARNLSGNGPGTQVTIETPDQRLMSSYIVPGAVAGTLLFLLVLGILLWRWRQSSKEPLQSRSEAEMNQMETSSPLPADEVTYVDLNSHKRHAKAEEEVVYTEVKTRPKQRDDNDIYAKVNPRHR